MTIPLLLLLLAGQQSPSEMTVRDQTPVFKTALNMVEVPVVVRDYKGRAVGDLTKDDFRLFDRGKPQTIAKFTLEKSTGPDVMVPVNHESLAVESVEPAIPAAVLPDRFVAYLFDDAHVSPADLELAREAADRHMKKSLGPKTRAAIFTTSGQTMLDFTDDREKWHEYLYRIRANALDKPPSGYECPVDLTYRGAMETHGGLKTGLPVSLGSCPGGEFRVAVAARVIARTELATGIALQLLRDLVKRMAILPGERTVVLASNGFIIPDTYHVDVNLLFERAIRANVVINTLDVRGLRADAHEYGIPHPSTEGIHQDNNDRMDVLAEIAYGTGGIFYHNSNDLDTGFDRVAGNPQYRYILTFSPPDLKPDGSLHALKVSLVPNPHHYEILAREHYAAPKRLDDPVEEAKQEITSAVFGRDELRDLTIDLHAGFTRLPAGGARLTVLTHVDLKGVKLHRAADRNQGDLTVTAAAFDSNGNYVAGIQQNVDLKLKDENLDKWMTTGIQVRNLLEVKPGNYLVRVVVRDSEGNSMAARNTAVNIQ